MPCMVLDWLLGQGWEKMGVGLAVKDITEKADGILSVDCELHCSLAAKFLHFDDYNEVVCVRECLCS